MARSGKCRVLVAAGKPVALQEEAIFGVGVRVDASTDSVWAALAKARAAEPERCEMVPREPEPVAKRSIGRPRKEVDKYTAKWLDPRDVPLWKPDVYLRWCLDNNALRDPGQHAAMAALWFENGDVEACARVTGQQPAYLADLLRQAKAEVRMAARQMDWQEGWAASRLEPGPHNVARVQLADSRVWFPPPCDWMAFAFGMDRRVSP